MDFSLTNSGRSGQFHVKFIHFHSFSALESLYWPIISIDTFNCSLTLTTVVVTRNQLNPESVSGLTEWSCRSPVKYNEVPEIFEVLKSDVHHFSEWFTLWLVVFLGWFLRLSVTLNYVKAFAIISWLLFESIWRIEYNVRYMWVACKRDCVSLEGLKAAEAGFYLPD